MDRLVADTDFVVPVDKNFALPAVDRNFALLVDKHWAVFAVGKYFVVVDRDFAVVVVKDIGPYYNLPLHLQYIAIRQTNVIITITGVSTSKQCKMCYTSEEKGCKTLDNHM